MEILLELIIELVLQFLFEILVEGGTRGVARVLETGRARVIAVWSASITIALAGGFWWGAHVAGQGRTGLPDSVWASLVLAALTGAMALRTATSPDVLPSPAAPPGPMRPFTAERWALIATMSACAALSIFLGFRAC